MRDTDLIRLMTRLTHGAGRALAVAPALGNLDIRRLAAYRGDDLEALFRHEVDLLAKAPAGRYKERLAELAVLLAVMYDNAA